MPEIISRQVTAQTGAGKKMTQAESYGKKRVVLITSPATAALAQNDTIASGMRLPKGTRFLAGSVVSHAALGTSVTMDIGIRNFDTKAVIDVDGIADGLDVAAAGRTVANNGALVAAGNEYVTAESVEIYATLLSANPTDDAQFRIEVEIATTD